MDVQEGNGPYLHSQDCFSRKRNLKELLHLTGDDLGYIEGKVFMIWPPRNRLHRLNLEVVEDSTIYRFEVEIPHKDGITFRPHERVYLALKGMRVVRRNASSAPHYFPIVLRFPDGVVLKYLNGANAGKVVNSWEGNTDEWYNPDTTRTVSDAVTIDMSEIQHGPVQTLTHPRVPTPPRRDATSCYDEGVKADLRPLPSTVITDGTAAQSMRPAQQAAPGRPGRSSKRPRKKRRLHKESTFTNQLGGDADRPRPADVAACHEQPLIPILSPSISVFDGHPKLGVSGQTNEAAPIREDSRIDVSCENNHGNAIAISRGDNVPALQLKAGIRTQRGDVFTALSDLQKGHSMINIIGIVTSAHPEKKTRTNEWSRSFSVTDPSVVDITRHSIKVNCFQKKYLEWLPQVQKNDIVILRKLKNHLFPQVDEFNGALTAVGYSDKLRWAVYDPLEHFIRPPNKGSAPDKEAIDQGMGYEFTPYWVPEDSTELEYCRQIGDWWKAMHEFEGQTVSMVQCSEARKQHLLISEASPDHPPKGFFDCTVEVLQKFDNPGGATAVYVTDYTANALVHPVQGTWCPPELHDRVLQCAMWDDARNIARMMNPGEYWYLHNVRAKWNPTHYMEGTMQLAEKVTRLDQTKLEAQPHLRALLARKNVFKSGLGSSPVSLHIFPEMLLQDVEGSTSFLTCIVELLRNDLFSRDGHFIYVTDYTFNPDLPSTATADWARNLEHRVLMIKLDDAQAEISSDLVPGSVVIIHNLRIKHLNAHGDMDMHGCLGGEDKLILSLHDLSDHRAQTLQRNKDKWKRENMLEGLAASTNGSHEGAYSRPLRPSSTPLDDTTLQEVLTRPAPDVFRVLARAVDFYPFSFEDACVLRCTKCESSPPSFFKRCPRCDDMVETHSKWFYCLYIQLRDEKGREVIVSLSGKECMLLQGVDPTDFRCDPEALHRFLARLDPILGNLRDVHAAWSRNEHKVVESPLMIFTIESWNVGDERGYSLLNYKVPA